MSGFIRGRTPNQDLNEVAEVSGGALHVVNAGIIGNVYSAAMYSEQDITPANANEVWTNSTGVKQAILNFAPAGSTTYVIIAYSTTHNQGTALNTLIDAKETDRAAGSAVGNGDEVTNTFIFYPSTAGNSNFVITWNGVTTIKTIATQAKTADIAYDLTLIY
jgi:hypothetical protein